MDKILAPIKQRIIHLIDFKGIKKGDFYEKIGVSASNFRSKSLYSEIGGEVIAKISSVYPEVNLRWLLTGKGDILISENNETPKPYDKDQYIIDLQRALIKKLEREITELKKINEQGSHYRIASEPDS